MEHKGDNVYITESLMGCVFALRYRGKIYEWSI